MDWRSFPLKKWISYLVWAAVSAAGAAAFGILALSRGESINAVWLLVAAVCTYAVAYRFYSRFLAQKVFELDDKRKTPAEVHNDGKDYVPTNKWVLFGHHFAAIAGAGPLVGPILAAQMGYLPGTLWIIVGVVLGERYRISSSCSVPCAETGNPSVKSPGKRSDPSAASSPSSPFSEL